MRACGHLGWQTPPHQPCIQPGHRHICGNLPGLNRRIDAGDNALACHAINTDLGAGHDFGGEGLGQVEPQHHRAGGDHRHHHSRRHGRASRHIGAQYAARGRRHHHAIALYRAHGGLLGTGGLGLRIGGKRAGFGLFEAGLGVDAIGGEVFHPVQLGVGLRGLRPCGSGLRAIGTGLIAQLRIGDASDHLTTPYAVARANR